MKVEYRENLIIDGNEIVGDLKTSTLPFSHISARAIILRKRDGAILGALHRPDGQFALLGGAIDDQETPEDTILRELEEEGITLVGCDGEWHSRLAVDYYPGYNELCLWYLFLVEDAKTVENDELLEIKWIDQDRDLWYPYQREKILLTILQFLPDLVQIDPDS